MSGSLLGNDIFFFADQATIRAQEGPPGDEAFGPVGDSEATRSNQFRVTSLHKGNAGANPVAYAVRNPAAYAVCKGRVRVQADDTDSTLLTLVLAPDVEVLRGVPIRFFVYRGIRRDSLIDNAGKLISGALTNRLLNDNDVSNDIPEALGLAFRPAASSPRPSADFVREDTDPIDTLFFETTTLKAIPVQAGDELGAFDGAGFGFEVMVRSIWEAPTLKLLRSSPVSGNPNAPPRTGNILKIPPNTAPHVARALREQVYGYLDPCAFYGMCFDRKGGVRYKIASPAAAASADSAQEIYDKLLTKFHNRNKVYIDLRNDNGLSYNYYDTYGTGQILLELNTSLLKRRQKDNLALDATQPESYTTDGWPLKIIDASAFTVPSDGDKAGIRLAMRIGEPLTAAVQRQVFFEFARLYYHKRGRRRSGHVFEPGERLVNVIEDLVKKTDAEWTTDVVLGIPTVTAGNSPLPIAFCVRLRYLRQNEAQPSTTGRYVSTEGEWDNIFTLQRNPSRWKNDNLSNWWLTGHIKRVAPQLDNQQVFEGMAEAGFAVDRDPVSLSDARYTFYYVPVYVKREPKSYQVFCGLAAAGTGGATGSAKSSFFQRKESGMLRDGSSYLHLAKVSEFHSWNPDPLDDSQVVPPDDPSSFLYFLTFLENAEVTDPANHTANPNHSKESLYAISISAAEYATLLWYATDQGLDSSLHPVFLQVRRRVYPRNDDTATERSYQALELRLAGFDQSGNYCSVDIPSGPAGVFPLSLPADGFIFCTNDAAVFEPLKPKWDFVPICTQRRNTTVVGAVTDEEHEKDFIYFGRAMADIKAYLPTFYKRMQNMHQLGVEVILPDDPGVRRRRRYRIEVTFDKTLTTADGDTKLPHPDDSISKNLQTLAATSPAPTAADVRYGGLNATRYVHLNKDRSLKSSQVNERFLMDYTDAEIAGNVFDPAKIYLEISTDGGTSATQRRTTLAELRQLGFGTFDPMKSITIRISRPKMEQKKEKYVHRKEEPLGTLVYSFPVPLYNERRWYVTETLAHELAHAEAAILDSLASLLWATLEGVFDGKVVDLNATRIVTKKDEGIYNQLANLRLVRKEVYPYPPTIASKLDLNVAINQALNQELKEYPLYFLAKTGGGHLRGSPNAKHACMVEREIALSMEPLINNKIASAGKGVAGFDPPGGNALEFPADYCFLNFDDADLNPNNQ